MVMNKVIQNEIIRLAAETGAKAAMEAMEKQKLGRRGGRIDEG